MADRRRINGPPTGTLSPIFVTSRSQLQSPQRVRKPNQLRKIYLETGVVPTATGSAYLELEDSHTRVQPINSERSSLKLLCAIHGPKPLPRNATFSPNLQLTVNVKFAPFATRQRRGYTRDETERDIATHLETALNGVIIPDRWPKSAIDILITVLEAEESNNWTTNSSRGQGVNGLAYMNVVSWCITLASAALLDAEIDCLDVIVGGMAATVLIEEHNVAKVLDPAPCEDPPPRAVCVVGYMPARDEITLAWAKGDMPGAHEDRLHMFDGLLDSAITAARGSQMVLRQIASDLAQVRSRTLGLTDHISEG